jgi:hypothetical protein
MDAFKEEERTTLEERGWRHGERRLGINKDNYRMRKKQ